MIAHYVPIKMDNKWGEVIDSSYHQYVKVLENNSNIFEEPSLEGTKLGQIRSGQLLLQADFKEIGDLAWNKVLLGAEKFGWIILVSPPQMGVPEKRISEVFKFYFRYKTCTHLSWAFCVLLSAFGNFASIPFNER